MFVVACLPVLPDAVTIATSHVLTHHYFIVTTCADVAGPTCAGDIASMGKTAMIGSANITVIMVAEILGRVTSYYHDLQGSLQLN